MAKALHHKVLPPTLHIDQPNAGYDAQHSPFMLNRVARPWVAAAQAVPHAAVSAFGFGGTNFHAVLSACPNPAQSVESGVPQWPAELLVFRGESFEVAARQMQRLGKFLRESDAPLKLRDLAWTQAMTGCSVQCSIVANDVADLLFKLECAHLREKQAGVHYRQHDEQGKLAFVFPGQGSQSPGMLQDLFVAFPTLQEILIEGAAWCDKLFPPTAYDRVQQQQQQRDITDTRVAQPTLGL